MQKIGDDITPWNADKDNILLIAEPNESVILKSKSTANDKSDSDKEVSKNQIKTSKQVNMKIKPILKTKYV